MVVQVAPQPTPPTTLPEFPITIPPERESLPGDLETILEICSNQFLTDVMVPLLEADDLEVMFRDRWDTYQRWNQVAAAALVAVVGKVKTLELAQQVDELLSDLNRRRGPELLDPTATKALEASLNLRRVVMRSLLNVLGNPDNSENVAPEITKVSTLLTAQVLCSSVVAHYLKQDELKYQENANCLAMWSQFYADSAYATWGSAQLGLGLYSKL